MSNYQDQLLEQIRLLPADQRCNHENDSVADSEGYIGCVECDLRKQLRNLKHKHQVERVEGVEAPESEVSTALGYKDVYEFRRACTEQGHRIRELEHALRVAKDDVRHMQWAGRRMECVLERIEKELLMPGVIQNYTSALEQELLLAIRVVCGRGVDWDHKLVWLREFEESLVKELPPRP